MKFLFGVVIGAVVGPHLYDLAGERYGHIIFPYLEGVAKRIENWEPPKEK